MEGQPYILTKEALSNGFAPTNPTLMWLAQCNALIWVLHRKNRSISLINNYIILPVSERTCPCVDVSHQIKFKDFKDFPLCSCSLIQIGTSFHLFLHLEVEFGVFVQLEDSMHRKFLFPWERRILCFYPSCKESKSFLLMKII